MWEGSHVVVDEQILFKAPVTSEELGVVLLAVSGAVAFMMGWRHSCRLVSAFNVV
jgi:hypothetical protein